MYGYTNMWIHFYISVPPRGLCVCIDSRCRKHWPVLRAVNVSEQTHTTDFFFNVCFCVYNYVSVYDWGERGETYIYK